MTHNNPSAKPQQTRPGLDRRGFVIAGGAAIAAVALGQASAPAALAVPSGAQQRQPARQLMFNKWNFGPTPFDEYRTYVDEVERDGFTCMKLHVPWAKVVGRTGVVDFSAFDQQFDYILQSGLKVSVGIDLLRTFIDGQDAILRADQVMTDTLGRPNVATNNQNLSQFSFASSDAVARAADFVSEVATRYSRRGGDSVLFYETTMTPFVESEYWNQVWNTQTSTFVAGHYDYSPQAITRFRAWLEARYSTIGALNSSWGTSYGSFAVVPAPPDFHGATGVDWYMFRHTMLESTITRFARAVHCAGPQLRHSVRFGSTYDTVAGWRGTVLFPQLARHVDVVHVDDAPRYNHPFAMDLLNTSLPPVTWTGNEIDGPGNADDATYYQQAAQSFEHGATIVNAANWNLTSLQGRRSLFQSISADFLGSAPLPVEGGVIVPVSASEELAQGSTTAAQAAYNLNSANGSQRIRVPLEDPPALSSSFSSSSSR